SDRTYDELVGLAAQAPPFGPLIDPDDPSFAEPGDMPARIGAYCTGTGQHAPTGQAAVVRCILESLALKQAATVDTLATATRHETGGVATGPRPWTCCEASPRPRAAGTPPPRRDARSSTGSSTARTCSEPTAPSRTGAAATPRPRAPSSTTRAATRQSCGSRA